MTDRIRPTQRIALLGRLCGIAPSYRDNFGEIRVTSSETYQALLSAMGVPWEAPELREAEIRRRRFRVWEQLLPPVVVLQGKAPALTLSPTLSSVHPDPQGTLPASVELRDATGRASVWEGVFREPTCLATRDFPGPDGRPAFRHRLRLHIPLHPTAGYYEVTLRLFLPAGEETGTTRLIVAPARVFLPDGRGDGEARVWGFNLPLYALRRAADWGMGDFSGLREVMAWAAGLGAAFVGVNPLHAFQPGPPLDPSPYAPASRLFLNFLYLDVERVPDLADCPEVQTFLDSPGFRAELQRLQATPLVDYLRVHNFKTRVLRQLFTAFLDRHGPPAAPRTPRGGEFARFMEAGGDDLSRWGQFNALADHLGQSDWRHWPQALRNPDDPEVAAFAEEQRDEVWFHQYVQWLAQEQLGEVYTQAHRLGLPFSLYQDLPLGSHPGGLETWAHRALFAPEAAMGAPPDAFNPKGQNWGLSPLIPERLRENGYRLFSRLLEANCPPDGSLRLDHVMGLFRLFWIPPGQDPGQGAYVHYPARELLAVLALESVRRRTLIIGEDLGTVSPRIRRDLGRAGVFSYKVFYFERDAEQHFLPPEAYPRRAVAAVTTHDLPTLADFWQATDVDLKLRLNLYPDPDQARWERQHREEDRRRLLQALEFQGLLPPDLAGRPPSPDACPEELRLAVLAYLGRSPAALLEVRLEDLFGVLGQQNVPGTVREHPNWRRKLPATVEEITRSPEGLHLAQNMARCGRIPSG